MEKAHFNIHNGGITISVDAAKDGTPIVKIESHQLGIVTGTMTIPTHTDSLVGLSRFFDTQSKRSDLSHKPTDSTRMACEIITT